MKKTIRVQETWVTREYDADIRPQALNIGEIGTISNHSLEGLIILRTKDSFVCLDNPDLTWSLDTVEFKVRRFEGSLTLIV